MSARPSSKPQIPAETQVELVRSLFATLAPTTIMGILFIVVASTTLRRTFDPTITLLAAGGTCLSLLRVAIILAYERQVGRADLDFTKARLVERVFGCAYLAFAATLGLFAARALRVADAEMQITIAPLVVGYAAGVAAGVSLRPWISVPAVLLAVVPTALVAALEFDTVHALLALILVALLAGGVGSMLARYRSEVEKLAMRQTFAALARTDQLTGLANRLALREALEREAGEPTFGQFAIHCLDLDRFKAVNDRLGHPAGDALLVQVADRLRNICRGRDVAARLGGDEFTLLQTRICHDDEVDLMARRIVRTITQPYCINGEQVFIGASVGYAVPETCGPTLSQLLQCADTALYRIKREGGGAAAYSRSDDDTLMASA